MKTDFTTSSPPSELDLSNLTKDDLEFLERKLTQQTERLRKSDQLRYYRPYAKQHEFHCAGALDVYQRLFMAGNQLGKSLTGAAEMALHLTGRYDQYRGPNGEEWTGRRFHHPITALAGSESSELTRDGIQRLLVGPPAIEEEWGTGFIPKDAIVGWSRKSGVPNALDSITVQHREGGQSQLFFKSYDQGRGKWQANTVHIVWFDEEPPFDVYSEGVTRTTATRGSIMITFTPLNGMSQVVKRFLNEPSKYRKVVNMTINDVTHLTPQDIERLLSEYPEHERDARAMGIPMLGSGAIFPVADATITIDPIKLQPWFRHLGGMDFGYDHPFGATEIAYDGDLDVIYIVREYRVKSKTPADHATVLRPWNLRWAWPHDGMQHDKGSGMTLRDQYKRLGLQMLPEHATFADGGYSAEAAIFDMLERMTSGRLKVFSTCNQWLEEKRMYHREDGKIIKLDDDLLSSSRYAIMMLRHARPVERANPFGFGGRAPQRTAEGTGSVNF